MEKDVTWDNKHEFLSVPIEAVDHFNLERKKRKMQASSQKDSELKGRQFT